MDDEKRERQKGGSGLDDSCQALLSFASGWNLTACVV